MKVKVEEKELVRCKSHRIVALGPAIMAFFALVLLSVGMRMEGWYVSAVAIALFAACILWGYLNLIYDSLVLTEYHVIGKKGILRTADLMSPIGKINDISVRKSIPGRILGYATITISTAGTGGTEYKFSFMQNVDLFQQKFMELSERQP
jgi:uncharacterized membrane protein YdbT with pleckstrin-like domain